jgi:hypothetical protein
MTQLPNKSFSKKLNGFYKDKSVFIRAIRVPVSKIFPFQNKKYKKEQ